MVPAGEAATTGVPAATAAGDGAAIVVGSGAGSSPSPQPANAAPSANAAATRASHGPIPETERRLFPPLTRARSLPAP